MKIHFIGCRTGAAGAILGYPFRGELLENRMTYPRRAPAPPTAPTAPTVLQAMRLMGRWALLAQGFGASCNCCSQNRELELIEQQILGTLRLQHAANDHLAPLLAATEPADAFTPPDSLADLIRGLALRRVAEGPELDAISAVLRDLDAAITQAERAVAEAPP